MNQTNKLIIQLKDRLHVICQNDITFCKSDSSHTELSLKNGEKLLISKSLTAFSNELEKGKFIRVSQSHLINIGFIKIVDKRKKEIVLTTNYKIPFTTTIKKLLYIARNNVAPVWFIFYLVDLFSLI
jgi:two-component system, LytTR family, response regulator